MACPFNNAKVGTQKPSNLPSNLINSRRKLSLSESVNVFDNNSNKDDYSKKV
jgi:hypothetical protein